MKKPKQPYNPEELKKAAAMLGALGGRASFGPNKRNGFRSSEQARRAVRVRWDAYRKKQSQEAS